MTVSSSNQEERRARIRVAVIGVGHLGERHARVYSELPGADLTMVVDIDRERAESVGSAYGASAVTDFRDVIGDIDAASVAVPTVNHHEVVVELLRCGIDVLVEKPIAPDRAQAGELISAARQFGRCLAVGHTERYNPAVEALLERASDPRFIEVHRLGSFSSRSLDIDVVLDLMIHDLDIVSALVRRPVISIEAIGVPVLTPRMDIANARLKFEGGAVANLTASRVSQDKVRKLRVFERDRYISLDYIQQEAVAYRVLPKDNASRPDIRRELLTVRREEPLRRELEDFLEAVKGRVPRVRGEEGLQALDLALRVIEEMETPD